MVRGIKIYIYIYINIRIVIPITQAAGEVGLVKTVYAFEHSKW